MRPDLITHAFGIDISDGSLELANVQENREGTPILAEFGRIVLPEHAVVHGRIQDPQLLHASLDALFRSTGIDPKATAACIALPDSQVVTKILPLPDLGAMPTYDVLQRSAQALYRDLNYRIKNPVLRWSYRELSDKTGELTLFATGNDSLQQWKLFFKKNGIALASVEMESLAIARSLIQQYHAGESVAIIDFGFRMTTVSISDKSGLRYSHTIEKGGYDLTTLIAHTIGSDLQAAEQHKVEVGLTGNGDKKLQELLKKEIDSTLAAIDTSIIESGQTVTHVMITGGGARLRGIRELTEETLELPTVRAIPWLTPLHVRKGHLGSSQIPPTHEQYYAGALGLAIRGMNRYTLAKGVNFIDIRS